MKEKKDTVNPNPTLDRATYEKFQETGASITELIDGYTISYYAGAETLNIIRENEFKLKYLRDKEEQLIKELKSIRNDINNLEAETKKIQQENTMNIQDTKAVQSAIRQVRWLVSEREKELEEDTVKHWNVKKIGFGEIKRIADKANAPVKAVIQGYYQFNPTDFKKHLKGVNKYLK